MEKPSAKADQTRRTLPNNLDMRIEWRMFRYMLVEPVVLRPGAYEASQRLASGFCGGPEQPGHVAGWRCVAQ